MRDRGVVDVGEADRLVGAVSGLGQQFLGLGVTLGLGHLGGRGIRRHETGGRRRREVVGRDLAALQDVVDDHVAIDGVGNRLTDAHVLERLGLLRRGLVDVEVIGAQLRHRERLVGLRFLHRRVLTGRNVRLVDFTGLEAGDALVLVVDGEEVDRGDDGLGVVPVFRVALDRHPLAGRVFGEDIGAVADDVFGFRPVGAELLDHRLRDREQRGVRGHADEIRHRLGQRDLKGLVVDRLDAQIGDRELACDDIVGILHTGETEEIRVVRSGLGIDGALPAVDEVAGLDRIAIGPHRVAQVECVDREIGIGLIARGGARNRIALGILVVETLEQIADHIGGVDVFDDIGIERVDVVQNAIVEGLVSGQLGAGGDIGRVGRKSERGGAQEGRSNGGRPPNRLEFHYYPSPFLTFPDSRSSSSRAFLLGLPHSAAGQDCRTLTGKTVH